MNTETVDIAIVGAGVSGLYSAWRLLSDPSTAEKKITVIEASDRLGGRLHTVNTIGGDAKVEMGAMRFPKSHVLVSSLLDQLKIPVEPFPNLTLLQMFLRGTPVGMSTQGQPDRELPYKLAGNESVNPFLLLLNAMQRYVGPDAAKFTLADWDNFFQKNQVEGRPYYMWGFWNLFERVATDEAYQLVQASLGIESATANWNAAMSLRIMMQLLNDFVANQFFRPSNGWSDLPDKLSAAIESAVPNTIRLSDPVRRLHLDTADKDHPYHLILGPAVGPHQVIKASQVVLAMPRLALERLEVDARLSGYGAFSTCLARVAQIPAFRIYVHYETPWWQRALGFTHGYSVTDLPIKQCFYGAGLAGSPAVINNFIMGSYADYDAVEFWRGLIETDQLPQGHLHAPDPGHDLILECVEGQMRHVHSFNRQFPKVIEWGYADWSSSGRGFGWHSWLPGGDLNTWIPQMRQPFQPHPIFICGEAYSNFQGWVEGALGSAENLMQKCFGLAAPSWMPTGAELGP